jgi:hypothetical protein
MAQDEPLLPAKPGSGRHPFRVIFCARVLLASQDSVAIRLLSVPDAAGCISHFGRHVTHRSLELGVERSEKKQQLAPHLHVQLKHFLNKVLNRSDSRYNRQERG